MKKWTYEDIINKVDWKQVNTFFDKYASSFAVYALARIEASGEFRKVLSFAEDNSSPSYMILIEAITLFI